MLHDAPITNPTAASQTTAPLPPTSMEAQDTPPLFSEDRMYSSLEHRRLSTKSSSEREPLFLETSTNTSYPLENGTSAEARRREGAKAFDNFNYEQSPCTDSKATPPCVFEDTRRRHERDVARAKTGPAGGPRRAGFFQQLRSTIYRTLLLQLRSPCSCVCELLIPIIFVAGTIILWAIFGQKTHASADYYTPGYAETADDFYSSMTAALCYNATLTNGNPIGSLMECGSMLSQRSSESLYCGSPVSGTPEGLCGMASALATVFPSWIGIAFQSTTKIPTLDQFIPVQWAARMGVDSRRASVGDRSTDSAITSTGKLFVCPSSAATDALVAHLNASSVYFPSVYGGTLATVAEAEALARTRTYKDPAIWGILQVNDLSEGKFDVSIRLNATALPKTKTPTNKAYSGGVPKDGSEMYLYSGFSTLQKTIYDYHLQSLTRAADFPEEVAVLRTPTAEYRENKFLIVGGQFVPLILVLGLLYPVSQMTKRIVLEKELRIREAMLIMGLSEAVMYVAWLIVYTVQYAILSVIIAVLLRVTYLPTSNVGIVFALFFLYCLSVIALSGLMASFFNKARLSAILAPLIYFVLAIPLFAIQDAKPALRTGIMILSPSGLAVGISLVFDHQLAGGMKGNDMTHINDSPNMVIVFALLIFDCILYILLMLYFDAVLPKDWGTRKHPLFFIIDLVKWCFCRGNENDENLEDGRAPNGVFEEVEDAEKSAVRIVGLRKKFGSGKRRFLAVNNLQWSMKEGEISVLLGHNGAGKSTTMNMMTGMTAADAGDCYIYGKSVRHDLKAARQEIGFCPQHNILWPLLTCREHLEYFAAIKGMTGHARDETIDQVLEDVSLSDKQHCKSKNLSGGQKRKLSVAIAFVGGSRLVFLDEPTAGMDVGARRHTWELLRKMALSRTILLTTHFMDEAELLGDRVSIMSQGRMQCSGSNMFLKSKLGVGYVLTVSVVAHVERDPIVHLVHSYVPEAEELGGWAGEIGFRLPMSAKAVFPDLLMNIENDSESLGIKGYSLSATTLEEIFLQIAKGTHGEAHDRDAGNSKSCRADGEATNDRTAVEMTNTEEAYAERERVTEDAHNSVWNVPIMQSECSILWSQFRSMMVKRFWNSLRDRRTQFFQIICPVICILLAMLLTLIKLFDNPSIVLSSDMYKSSVEIDVAGCSDVMNLSTPFSTKAKTYLPDITPSAEDMSRFMADTYFSHPLGHERYSGLVCDAANSAAFVFYNSSSLHELGVGVSNLYSGYFRKAAGSDASFVTRVSTMPRTSTEDDVKSSIYAMMISVIIMIPFTFIPSTFVSWIVKERECKARHLQNVSGLRFSIYWLSNFLFDMCCYIITMFLVIIVFAIFNRQEYISPENAGPTIVLFFLYGVSGIAMAYAVSFLFNEHASAQNTVLLANFITGFLLVLCVTMLSLISSTEKIVKVLRWIFRIVPSFCMGEGISNLAVLKMQETFGASNGPWAMDVIGWPCVYMALELPFFVAITLIIDHPARRQRSQKLFYNPNTPPEVIEGEDNDVIAERESILQSHDRQNDLVRVEHLRKVYPNGKVAVQDVTFGVKRGEVFAFLGTNGAGKTTTISILCQEFYSTSGRAYICGHSLVDDSRAALQCIGYCPQFDATLDLLTVEEHLYLYAGVRAIHDDSRKRVVEGLMKLCELTSYRRTRSHELSGGNRRKLSVAISLIGGPRVVFLDEPSAGMDPVARRGLWTAIETVADNCSVVLTTHHLEEVEALAHRVAIMVDGTLRCIGDKTHLKNKYGSGFEVSIRVRTDDEDTKLRVEQFFAERFSGSTLQEYRSRRFTYELPVGTKLSEAFRTLEACVEELGAQDYSVSQTSIEQVFLRISEEAEDQVGNGANDEPHGCCHCLPCCK